MAGEIATDGWLYNNFPMRVGWDSWHDKDGSWAMNKSEILYYYNVQISGSYADNQLVEKQHISSLAEVKGLMNMLTTLTNVDNYKLNLAFNTGYAQKGLVLDNSYTLRNTGGATVLRISAINIVISEEYRFENLPENPIDRPTYTYEIYDVNFIGVYVNSVYRGRIGSNEPTLSINTLLGDTIYFSNGQRGLYTSRVKTRGNIYINT